MDVKANKEEVSETKVKLTIELAREEFEKFGERALNKISKTLDIEGFRKGKVPPKVAKDNVEEEKVAQQALSMAMPQMYAQAVKELDIIPVAQPEVRVEQFEKDKPLIIEAEVEVKPEVKLPDFEKIELEKETGELSKKELDEAIENLRKRMADYEEKEGKAEEGDWVEVTFDGYIDNAKVDQVSSKNHPMVLGEGGFIEGFEDQVIGLKAGDEKEFTLEMPEDHPDEFLKGKEIKFELKVDEVKKVVLPEIKDLAKKMGAGGEDEFKERFEEAQKKQKKQQADKAYEQKIVETIVEEAELKLPEGLVKQEFERLTKQYKENLSQQGMSLDDYFEKTNQDKEEFEKQIRETAKKNVKVGLVMAEIAEQEDIEPTEKDIKKKTEHMISQAMMQGQDKNEARDHYESEQGQRMVSNVVRNEQTLDKIKELIEG